MLSRSYLQDLYTIYLLPTCQLYSILYFFYLSNICAFLCVRLFSVYIQYIYIYILVHYTVHTHIYLVSYTILCQYIWPSQTGLHPPRRARGVRENPITHTHLYTHCICNHVYSIIYIYIQDIQICRYIDIHTSFTYIPTAQGERRSAVPFTTYMSYFTYRNIPYPQGATGDPLLRKIAPSGNTPSHRRDGTWRARNISI